MLCIIKKKNFSKSIVQLSHNICPVIEVTFAYTFHTLSVITIMGKEYLLVGIKEDKFWKRKEIMIDSYSVGQKAKSKIFNIYWSQDHEGSRSEWI